MTRLKNLKKTFFICLALAVCIAAPSSTPYAACPDYLLPYLTNLPPDQLPTSPIAITLGAGKTSYTPDEPIDIKILAENVLFRDPSGDPALLARKGFKAQDFHLMLTILDPDGVLVAKKHVVAADEPPPPYRYYDEQIQEEIDLTAIEEIAPNWFRITGMADARNFYNLGEKYGWYTAQLKTPLELFSKVAVTIGGEFFADLADPCRVGFNPLYSNKVRFEIAPIEPVAKATVGVTLNLISVGPGTQPETRKTALADTPIYLYRESDIPPDFQPVNWKVYPAVWLSVDPYKSGLTDTNGNISFYNITQGDYLLLTQYPISSDYRYVGGRLRANDPDWVEGGVVEESLRILRKADGKSVPGKTKKLTGSLLLITEPEFVEWTDTEETYPFVFESIGDWEVSTSIKPPEGFETDHKSLEAQVIDETGAVQFTVTDVGSSWVETAVEYKIKHKQKTEKIASKIGIKMSRKLAKVKKKTVYGDTEAPGPFKGGRKVKEKDEDRLGDKSK